VVDFKQREIWNGIKMIILEEELEDGGKI